MMDSIRFYKITSKYIRYEVYFGLYATEDSKSKRCDLNESSVGENKYILYIYIYLFICSCVWGIFFSFQISTKSTFGMSQQTRTILSTTTK